MASDVKDAHQELTDAVMGRSGVSGTAIGEADGRPCLKVYVASRDPKLLKSLPDKVRGFPVVVEETGTFRRL